jgi:hypothetical protein
VSKRLNDLLRSPSGWRSDPIIVVDRIDDVERKSIALGWFYRHNAMHAGTTPMLLDEFGRCARCVELGFWKPDA